ncbi:MAG TPA: glutamate racemase [Candidatus Paceibacterota bacterium]|nr:glutamate racemase [Candidatus Paceibacterota bacterium]HMP19237.1 glutamate racemase [Candidatus Paceibacterota bacterium]HMP85391.1 glutamate racemase [Candidatus Paceibacterota bacterium]
MKIGIFDSGFGGLDIFKNVKKELSEYDFVYLGDTARTPYGSRSQETIYKYTQQAVDFLFKKDCQLIIFACNTASAKALRQIQQDYLIKNYPDRRVLGVIIPATEHAILLTKNKKIGIIGTESTISSNAFYNELKKLDESVEVFQKACPLLVPIVESGENDSVILEKIIEKYLSYFLDLNIDTLILGCTHYGILKDKIEFVAKKIGLNISVISEGQIVSKKLKNYLERHPEINQKLSKNKKIEFYTTDLTQKFIEIGSILFGQKISAEKVNLE